MSHYATSGRDNNYCRAQSYHSAIPDVFCFQIIEFGVILCQKPD